VTLPNYEFVPEAQMVRTPAYDSFTPVSGLADGRSLRTPPLGTIIRGQMPLHYQPTLQDAIRAGQELQNPFCFDDTDRLERGTSIFTNYCQVCHGPLGLGNGPITRGGFPPPSSLLAERAVQMKDGQMFHVLTYGQGNMPAFNGPLSSDDRWSVILHIRMLQGPYSPEPAPNRSEVVAQLFRLNCAACHGEDGTGSNVRKLLPLIPNFTSLAWQMSQSELAIVNQIDYGSHPMMPAFRYKLTQEQILSLAVYVRSFAGHRPGGLPETATASHLTASSVYGTFCFACHDTNGKGIATIRSSMPDLPDFTAATWQKSRTDAEISHSILEGKGQFMLPMKDKLATVDVKEMVSLVRGFADGKQVIALEAPKAPGPPAPAVVTAPSAILSPTPAPTAPTTGPSRPPAEPLVAPSGEAAARIRIGATIFQQYCIVCHGPDGTGSIMRGSMPAIPNFKTDEFHNGHSDAQILVSILDGKGTLMPANRGRVTEQQAGDLVAYVRALGSRSPNERKAVTSANRDFEKAYRELEEQWNALEKELQKTKKKDRP
jgi:mono/diheme cytochrome c family protein